MNVYVLIIFSGSDDLCHVVFDLRRFRQYIRIVLGLMGNPVRRIVLDYLLVYIFYLSIEDNFIHLYFFHFYVMAFQYLMMISLSRESFSSMNLFSSMTSSFIVTINYSFSIVSMVGYFLYSILKINF